MSSAENFSPELASSLPAKPRLTWVDYAKGIGIFLVVLGHTLRGLLNSDILPASPLTSFVDQWIYAFHMPLFFFISGLFVQRSATKPLKDFLWDKVQVIVYPYFVWSILQSLLQVFASRYSNHPVAIADLWKIIYDPVLQFWFLYVLLILLVSYGIMSKLGGKPIHFLILAIALYAAHLLSINFGPWGVLYQIRMYAIYLAIGAIAGTSPLLGRLTENRTRNLGLIAVNGFVAIALAVPLQFTQVGLLVPVVALLGIVASLALAVLCDRAKQVGFIRTWGVLSLQIFVAHTIASSVLRIGLQKVLGISEPTLHLILGTVVGLYVPIVLTILCQRIKFPYLFTLRSQKA